MSIPISLFGGVDLMTAKPAVKPGTLRDCLNFEVGTRAGYTRMDGITRFDGRPSPSAYKLWRLTIDGAFVGEWAAGDDFAFIASSAVGGRVLKVDRVGAGSVIYVAIPASSPSPTLPDQIHNNVSGDEATVLVRDVLSEPEGSQATFDAALAALYSDRVGFIEAVPGEPGSDLIGHFLFRDDAFAVRDLVRVAWTGGNYTDENEGQLVTYNGDSYRILNVRPAGSQTGVLTLELADTGDDATPFGSPVLAELSVSGSFATGYVGIAYADGLDATGASPFSWELAGDDAGNVAELALADFPNIDFVGQQTDAGLYRSSSTGWSRVDLGREVAFSDGDTALENFNRDLTVSGVIDSLADVFASSATINGAADANLGADDGAEMSMSGNTDRIEAKFNFASIPDGARITGLQVTIQRRSNVGGKARDVVVDLAMPDGSSSENKAKSASWATAATNDVFGGENDLWGSSSLTAENIKDADFAVRLLVTRAVAIEAVNGAIDFVKATVWYQTQDRPVYFWNGTTDVPATLRHVQLVSGDTTTGDAAGYLTIAADYNCDKPRLICAGDEIRTAAAGAGTLLALAAARDVPMFLPGQTEIDNNRSRYKFAQANFYGRDEFDAVYGVSGAGVAFCFDGDRFIRIHTELSPDLDIPRHITKHGDCLVLGYYSGALLASAVGDPFEMRGANGATAIELGDRLTALRPLSGDALICVCQSSTRLVRGTTSDSFFASVLSPNRGGVEYTDADMGRVVICDGQGLFAADSPEQFGAAQRNYLSLPVHPWLFPRLQASPTSEQAYIRPIAALNVRSKNQYRLYFWDGYVLTMTNTEPVQFTFQRMFTPASEDGVEPLPWRIRAISSGVDSAGRERLFVSFYGGFKEGYLFEMDEGRTFDGDAVPAYIVLNPFDNRAPSMGKRSDRMFVFGVGGGNATLDVSRAVGYRWPDPDKAVEMVMGLATSDPDTGVISADAVAVPQPFKGSVDDPIEGDDVSWRFDHNSATEAPFTLQALDLYQDARGSGRGTVR